VLDESLLARLGVHKGYLDDEITTQEAEIERRSEAYRGGRPQAILAGRPVIVVDDGIATGATAMASIRWVRAQQPDSITFAAPVSSVAALALVGAEADDALSLVAPSSFQAVGHWYREFDQVTDEQVIRALETARVH
jgi:predicted phosphoribosyltransferase